MFSKDQEITHEAVNKKLSEIVSARGKKGTDRNTQIELLIGTCVQNDFTYVIYLCIVSPILRPQYPGTCGGCPTRDRRREFHLG